VDSATLIPDCEAINAPHDTLHARRGAFRWFVLLNLVGLVVVAIWFRCHALGNLPGINGDEAWYGVQAELVLHGQPIAWRTPTGNLLNPLFFGPQLLLHAMFEPSFALLRVTAALSGLMALALNWWFCRRVFGPRAAAISTVILAVLPINIVYSRLAWDASQSLLVTLAAVYLGLQAVVDPARRTRWSVRALIALAMAIVVHPTNLFVGSVVGVCLIMAWRNELPLRIRHVQRAPWISGALVAALGIAATCNSSWPRAEQAVGRIMNPGEYVAFGVNLLRLFSGVTVYEYVSGSVAPPISETIRWDVVPYDLAAGIAFIILGWGVYRRLSDVQRPPRLPAADFRNERGAIYSLIIGWGLSLVGFFVVAGPAAIAPHFERYGICLIGPGAILAALGLDGWLGRQSESSLERKRGTSVTAILAIVASWIWLADFHAEFCEFFQETGGRSHFTFRTAAIEPKAAALEYIVIHSNGSAQIAASDWWIYWPLRYLAIGRSGTAGMPQVDIEFAQAPNSSLVDRDVLLWQVEFTDSPACEAFRRSQRDSRLPITETAIADYSGRPAISLFQLRSQPRRDRADAGDSPPAAALQQFGADGKKN
jgi:hypothetical protein